MATARKQLSPRGQRVVGAIFALVGAGMLAGGLYWGWHTRQFLKTAATAPGVVVEMVASRGSKSTTYAPVYTFTDGQGVPHKIRSSSSSNPPSYSVGETVQVFYDPQNPESALLDGWFELWGGATIIGGMGSIFFAIGLLVALIPKKPPVAPPAEDAPLDAEGLEAEPIETESGRPQPSRNKPPEDPPDNPYARVD